MNRRYQLPQHRRGVKKVVGATTVSMTGRRRIVHHRPTNRLRRPAKTMLGVLTRPAALGGKRSRRLLPSQSGLVDSGGGTIGWSTTTWRRITARFKKLSV